MHLNRHALRVIRERTHLTVSELASRAGTSQPHLSNIEAGRRTPAPDLARRIADALDIPLEAILSTSPVDQAA